MSLPTHFSEPSQYFEKSLKFFKKYQHLFNFPNTDVLVNGALEEIDVKLENVDVYSNDFDLYLIGNDYMSDFFEFYHKLKPVIQDFQDVELEFLIDAPLSCKKKHEITHLAKAIDGVCKEVDCDTIVDFGSGLGYLDQQLYETTNYNVLGLECSENHYVSAKKRQRKYHLNSINRVKYIKHKITRDSGVNIEEYLKDKFPNCTCFCITGLHACADLTVDAIDLFLKLDNAKAIIIMPCCYHRLLNENNKFKNFPLSQTLKSVYDGVKGDFLTVPFLRLAAQSPNCEEKLENAVFNLMARAVIQLYAYNHQCKIKRQKRKAVHLKSVANNFDSYIQDAISGFNLINNENEDNLEKQNNKDFCVSELMSIWREIPEVTFKKAAIFILLQNYLQPVFENFVLLDRMVYLRENGVKKCELIKIVNEKISPRCLALLAQKK